MATLRVKGLILVRLLLPRLQKHPVPQGLDGAGATQEPGETAAPPMGSVDLVAQVM